MRRGLCICVAALGAVALGLPDAATAATPVSQSFTTPGEQQFVVPPGVDSVQVELIGGYGGNGNGGIPGGIPATATATLTVSPGEALYAEVAGNGQSAEGQENRGGYGGGGDGGIRTFLFGSAPTGGGGGGASDVQRCPSAATSEECGGHSPISSRLLVAGGGGGGGGNGLDPSTTAGGDGGGADHSGGAGAGDANSDAGGGGGSRATATAGGKAGVSGACEPTASMGCATKGEAGNGGAGGELDGGGGGGGIFGGGGGAGGGFSLVGSAPNQMLANGGGGGGGGGSSGVVPGAVGVSALSLLATAQGAQPSVTFTWTPSAPAAVTAAPSAVTATTATLGGTVNPSAWQITSCAFELSPAPAGVALFPCAQQLGAGVTPLPVSATATGLAPSTTYTATLLATSVQGTGSGSPVTFTTRSATATPAGRTPAPGSTLSPVVSAIKLSPTRFRRGTNAATLTKHSHKRVPVGTTISFTLSQAATVTLAFQRAQPGLSSAGHCLAPSPKRRHDRRCTRYTAVHGSVSIPAPAGTDRIDFDGLLAGGAKLTPGSYLLLLSASAATGTTSAARHPSFTLLG
jgi:hypothetical protein